METAESATALASIVKDQRTGLIATLVRRYGFDLAEESVDAAIEAALEQWPSEGIPASPRAWLLSVSRRRAIDRVRHRITADAVHADLRVLAPDEAAAPDEPDTVELPDDRLRLLFTCCHPAIAADARVALSLRWLSGLSTEDVARAFCIPVATMAQRLTRAKTKIEAARIPYEVPERSELDERLGSVLEVVYAIFNEGYVATTGTELQRVDLAEEAIRLAELVDLLLPERADVMAMLALMLLVHARRDARVASDGELVPLDEQDRSKWDRAAITRAQAYLRLALAAGPPGAYAIEAAIQALHDESKSFEATDFRQIVALYAMLRERSDAPIVRLNEVVARSMVDGPEAALIDLLALDAVEELRGHPGPAAAKADLYRRLGRTAEACAAYDEAIAATKNEVEKRFLARRRDAL